MASFIAGFFVGAFIVALISFRLAIDDWQQHDKDLEEQLNDDL